MLIKKVMLVDCRKQLIVRAQLKNWKLKTQVCNKDKQYKRKKIPMF